MCCGRPATQILCHPRAPCQKPLCEEISLHVGNECSYRIASIPAVEAGDGGDRAGARGQFKNHAVALTAVARAAELSDSKEVTIRIGEQARDGIPRRWLLKLASVIGSVTSGWQFEHATQAILAADKRRSKEVVLRIANYACFGNTGSKARKINRCVATRRQLENVAATARASLLGGAEEVSPRVGHQSSCWKSHVDSAETCQSKESMTISGHLKHDSVAVGPSIRRSAEKIALRIGE